MDNDNVPVSVPEALDNLRQLTECHCLAAYAERDMIDPECSHGYREDVDALEQALQSEKARADAVEAKAARYDWLRARWGRISETYHGDTDLIAEMGEDQEGWLVDADSLDAAIDAALLNRPADGGE